MSRVAYRKVLIQYRRTAFAKSLICGKCGGKVMDPPEEAASDEFYLKNQDFWMDLATSRIRAACRRCQVLSMRASRHKRRDAIRASEDHFTPDDVVRLFDEQKGGCAYCGIDLMRTKYHVDHVMPLSRGGSNGPDNIQLTCPTCNVSKGAKTHDEFIEYRLRKAKQ